MGQTDPTSPNDDGARGALPSHSSRQARTLSSTPIVSSFSAPRRKAPAPMTQVGYRLGMIWPAPALPPYPTTFPGRRSMGSLAVAVAAAPSSHCSSPSRRWREKLNGQRLRRVSEEAVIPDPSWTLPGWGWLVILAFILFYKYGEGVPWRGDGKTPSIVRWDSPGPRSPLVSKVHGVIATTLVAAFWAAPWWRTSALIRTLMIGILQA